MMSIDLSAEQETWHFWVMRENRDQFSLYVSSWVFLIPQTAPFSVI